MKYQESLLGDMFGGFQTDDNIPSKGDIIKVSSNWIKEKIGYERYNKYKEDEVSPEKMIKAVDDLTKALKSVTLTADQRENLSKKLQSLLKKSKESPITENAGNTGGVDEWDFKYSDYKTKGKQDSESTSTPSTPSTSTTTDLMEILKELNINEDMVYGVVKNISDNSVTIQLMIPGSRSSEGKQNWKKSNKQIDIPLEAVGRTVKKKSSWLKKIGKSIGSSLLSDLTKSQK